MPGLHDFTHRRMSLAIALPPGTGQLRRAGRDPGRAIADVRGGFRRDGSSIATRGERHERHR